MYSFSKAIVGRLWHSGDISRNHFCVLRNEQAW